MSGAIRITGLLVTLLAIGPVPDRPSSAGEPLASFAEVARTALAASIVVRGMDYASEAVAPPRPDLEPGEFDDSTAQGARALGAGVIVDPHGIALTSARVVGLASRLDVALADGTLLKAKVVGLDWRTDVAVLSVHSDTPLPYLALGDSGHVRAGDWIVAVGVPLGLEGTVTAGIITALPRPADSDPRASFLQTDAAIHRGFAGGPLVGMNGELVGVATALHGEGIGYALPAPVVRRVYRELLEKGRVSRPWLGVILQRLSADLARAFGAHATEGVLVADVLPASPAAGAGLRSGDVILEIDGHAATSRAQVERLVSRMSVGDTVRLRVRRAARDRAVSLRLGDAPDEWEVRPDLIKARRLLGIEVRPVTPAAGAVVVEVDADSPADLVGIEPGDVIREIDRKPIRNMADFQSIARRIEGSSEVLMLIQRADAAVYSIVRARPDP